MMRIGALGATALVAAACASSGGDVSGSGDRLRRGPTERGIASWYGSQFHGRRTANGEVYDMYGVSAAHRTLPFGTLVEVENLDNGKRLLVRINDRGPFVDGRIIDLSYGAAEKLDMVTAGVVEVRLTLVERPGSELPRIADADSYRVQVGAFREARNARRLAGQLRSRYATLEVSFDGRWHRVQIEHVATREEARQIEHELARQGYDAFVLAGGAR